MKQLEHFASLQVKPAPGWRGYAIDTVLALGGVALLTSLISVDHLYPRVPIPYSYIAYLFLVVALASTRGLYAALLASLLAFLAYLFFLVPDAFTIPGKRDLFTLCVFLAAAIIVAAAHQRAELARRRERELRILYEQAQELAALQERQRLARELHESVSQALYAIGLGAHTAREALESDPEQAMASIDYVLALAEAGLAEMRALIFELRPESLEMEGLVAALTKQVAVLRTRYKLTVEADLGEEPNLSQETKHMLYRVAQEALHNIVKHARATIVNLKLAGEENEFILEVRDNGRGFNPADPFPGHLGLRSMHERVTRMGGTLAIESVPGQGTCVGVRIPFVREN